uniref:Cell wall protein-like n=1 Tax=Oryza sativa subsp. japonica TaxID=39947 RepID=Q654R4_ORYSJ|nr:cell wall protein-like [Oryza sativa Japonica Group]BAD52611.1 cell wall protein-like [Oryza sativa Japonica Group]
MPPPIAGNARVFLGRPPLPPAVSVVRPRRRLLQRRRHLLHPGLPSASRGDRRRRTPAVALLIPPCRPPPAAPPASPVHPPAAPPPLPASQLPPLPRSALRFAGKAPETRPRRRPVASPPLLRLRPPLPRPRSAGRRRHHLPRLHDAALIPGITSSSPELRRNTVARAGFSFLLGGISPGCPFRHAHASAGAAISPLRGGVALHLVHSSVSPERHRREPLHPPRRSCSATCPSSPCTGRPHLHHLRHRSGKVALGLASPPSKPLRGPSSSSPIVLVDDVPSVARLVVSRRRLRRRHRSGVVLVVLVPVQPLPAVLVASSPVPVVVVVVVLSSFPVVVAFVPPSSRSRPSSAIAAEVVPSPFASVVPELSSPVPFVVVVPKPRRVVLSSFRRFQKRGSRSSPKVRKAVLSEQGKSHHP